MVFSPCGIAAVPGDKRTTMWGLLGCNIALGERFLKGATGTRRRAANCANKMSWPTMHLPVRPPFEPMEALPVDEIPAGPEWRYEPKWDANLLACRARAAGSLRRRRRGRIAVIPLPTLAATP
jgi:hypothetical protein